jgi:hypothetical protein
MADEERLINGYSNEIVAAKKRAAMLQVAAAIENLQGRGSENRAENGSLDPAVSLIKPINLQSNQAPRSQTQQQHVINGDSEVNGNGSAFLGALSSIYDLSNYLPAMNAFMNKAFQANACQSLKSDLVPLLYNSKFSFLFLLILIIGLYVLFFKP